VDLTVSEWNDILREKGIIPPKEEPVESEPEQEVDELADKDLDELDELEDDIDDRILE
jgi:hypothetical protein